MTSKINILVSKIKRTALILALFTFSFSALNAGEPNEDPVVGDSTHTTINDAHATEHGGHKKVDIAEVAFEHILDSHSWHFWGEHDAAVSIPLPVILKTNNGLVFFMSSKFHHDAEGKNIVEINGEKFVNYKEKIYYASEVMNENHQFLEFVKNDKGETVLNNATPLDFSLTKNVMSMLISVIIILFLFLSVAKAYKTTGITSAPKGKQSFLEPLILFVRDDIAKINIGAKSDKFVPYLLSLFFFIWINNLLGLLPFGANLTGNIAVTLVLAIITFIITNVNGNKEYWGHVFKPHAPVALWIILIPIEFAGLFIKPIALMIRLFANITAGHIIVISLIGLIFIFETVFVSPVAVAFALFIDVLELLVAFLQAYIFTMLTALYIGSAIADHNADGAHNSDDKKLEHAH
jgi:F-type H+-transporting ATPase subunit a